MAEVQFVANRWLATNEEDGATYVTLLPANGSQAGKMQMLKYRIHVSAEYGNQLVTCTIDCVGSSPALLVPK
jgi:hypothetical protein